MTKQNDYTAKNIKVLSEDVAASKFDYQKVLRYKHYYPNIPSEVLSRLIEASQRAGIDHELAIEKYVCENKEIQLTDEFYMIFDHLLSMHYQK